MVTRRKCPELSNRTDLAATCGEDAELGRHAAIAIEEVKKRSWRGVGHVHERRLRPDRAKEHVGWFTQGVARGLALPWANEWLRLWREAGISAHAMRQRTEIRGQMAGDFVVHVAGGEWVMREDCPEIGGSEHGSPAVRTRDAGRNVSLVPNGTGVLAFRLTHRWKRWAIIGRPCGTSAAGKFSGVPETARISESAGISFWKILEGNC